MPEQLENLRGSRKRIRFFKVWPIHGKHSFGYEFVTTIKSHCIFTVASLKSQSPKIYEIFTASAFDYLLVYKSKDHRSPSSSCQNLGVKQWLSSPEISILFYSPPGPV